MAVSLVRIVQDTDTRAGRVFDSIVIGLILFSIVTLSIETLPDLSAGMRTLLERSEVVVIILFTAEYFLRIATARRKLAYIFSISGLIDLIAILPFYLAFYLAWSVDLRSVRFVRVFRAFRILKLARYTTAIEHFARAFKHAKEQVILFLLSTTVIIYLSALGIYYCEHEAQPEVFRSVFHSLWWAVATLTTVGYGDVYPITAGGRLFTFIVLMVGLGLVAVPSGVIAATFWEVRKDENSERTRNSKVTRASKSVAQGPKRTQGPPETDG